MNELSVVLLKAMQYSILALFGFFVLGAWLLAILGYRLREQTVGHLRRVGWLMVGLAFSLIGIGWLFLVVHQVSQGEAHVVTRTGSRLGFAVSTDPFFFVLAVVFELFSAGLFIAIGHGYMRLASIPRSK